MCRVLKSGSLNLLEPSGPVQACNGISLHLVVDSTENSRNWIMVSKFRRGVNDLLTLLGCYAALVVTDVSGQTIGAICKDTAWPVAYSKIKHNCLTLEDGTDKLSLNVGKYQSTFRNIPQQRRLPQFWVLNKCLPNFTAVQNVILVTEFHRHSVHFGLQTGFHLNFMLKFPCIINLCI